MRARVHFSDVYQNNIVQWDGYFLTLEVIQTSTFILADGSHSVNIGVKMSPSESALGSDLFIGFHAKYYKQHQSLFDSLKPGDHVYFEAYMAEVGDEYKAHHLHGKSLTKQGEGVDPKDINVKKTKIHLE